MFRWIAYSMQNSPGNQSFLLSRHESLIDAEDNFERFCREVYSDDCHSALYAYSDEAWESAEDFRDVGCPFDYPDRLIEHGPRGGIVVNRT